MLLCFHYFSILHEVWIVSSSKVRLVDNADNHFYIHSAYFHHVPNNLFHYLQMAQSYCTFPIFVAFLCLYMKVLNCKIK